MSTSLTQQESEYKWRRTESSRDESIAIFLSDMKHEMRNIISRRREKSDVKSVTVRILYACMLLKILNFPRKTKVLLISFSANLFTLFTNAQIRNRTQLHFVFWSTFAVLLRVTALVVPQQQPFHRPCQRTLRVPCLRGILKRT